MVFIFIRRLWLLCEKWMFEREARRPVRKLMQQPRGEEMAVCTKVGL